jgi:hypothetical protein
LPKNSPEITEMSAGLGRSWVPTSSPISSREFEAGEVDQALAKVVSVLIRGLFNRNGDLHLTAVAPVVNRMPDKQAAWDAIILRIVSHPDIAPLVRTVTDRTFTLDIYMRAMILAVELPPNSRRLLGLLEHVNDTETPPGDWVLGELKRPANLLPSYMLQRLAEPAEDAGGALFKSGVEESA